MSTPTLIGAVRHPNHYTARYLHWGTEPVAFLTVLHRIWADTFARDTVAMLEALLAHDWTALDPTARSRRYGDEPTRGVGYRQPTGLGLRHGRINADADGWLEWMYLIDARTDEVTVCEATCHGRWLLHSRHRLQSPPTDLPPNTGETYDTTGHRWTPATIGLPRRRRAFPAEVCVGHHPHGMIIARISDDVADAIAKANAASADRRRPVLRRSGTEFDLVWPAGEPLQEPMRLPRDEDGQIVVATPWWPWPPTAAST
jgi:hypothetical protein